MSIVLGSRNPDTAVIKVLAVNHCEWLMKCIQPPQTQVNTHKILHAFRVFTDLLKYVHKPHSETALSTERSRQ